MRLDVSTGVNDDAQIVVEIKPVKYPGGEIHISKIVMPRALSLDMARRILASRISDGSYPFPGDLSDEEQALVRGILAKLAAETSR